MKSNIRYDFRNSIKTVAFWKMLCNFPQKAYVLWKMLPVLWKMLCDVPQKACDVRKISYDVRKMALDVRKMSYDVRKMSCNIRQMLRNIRQMLRNILAKNSPFSTFKYMNYLNININTMNYVIQKKYATAS
jgi:hypothetical protein